jgi:hypothetical protein
VHLLQWKPPFTTGDPNLSESSFSVQSLQMVHFTRVVLDVKELLQVASQGIFFRLLVDASKRDGPSVAHVTIQNQFNGQVYFRRSFGYEPNVPKTADYIWDLRDEATGEYAPLGPYIATLRLHAPHPGGLIVDNLQFDIVGTGVILATSYTFNNGKVRVPVSGVQFTAEPLNYQKIPMGGSAHCKTAPGVLTDKAHCF